MHPQMVPEMRVRTRTRRRSTSGWRPLSSTCSRLKFNLNLNLNLILILILILCFISSSDCMSTDERIRLRDEAKEMFYHGFNGYMNHAYPADELMPLSCRGRFRDKEPNRGDIDDALGNFSLTLIDSMDSLVILNNLTEFERTVSLVVRDVSFDSDLVVSVFETNIRVLGGLLSGHILAKYIQEKESDRFLWYKGQLLTMAKDIGYRLLPAFNTSTGIPHPRINLKYGMKSAKIGVARDTCTACAGTMILEFGALSRLTGEPIFETKARKAMDYLWQQRHRVSDLVGTVLNIHSGDWVRRDSGVGAGIDSYYEYLFKAYILLGDDIYLERFNKHYVGIMKYISQGPLLVDVHMHRPHTNAKSFMDSLLAFWPGLQVLKGDMKPAIETHEMLYQVMQRHNFLMPEAFTVTDFQVHWGQHLLRPEFLESTYFLYKATGDDHYLEVGKKVMESLQKFTRTRCGFAAVKDVRTGSQEDRMDSFVLAETFKYLYLLFATKEDLVLDLDNFIFTTEAHLLPLNLAIQSPNRSEASDSFVKIQSPYLSFIDDDNYESSKPFQTCPNSRYLFSGSFGNEVNGNNYVRDIRDNLKDFVQLNSKATAGSMSTCSSSSNTRPTLRKKLRIAADEFSASNQLHLETVKKMGISVVLLPDGRVQLIHSVSAAATTDDADEGAQFMQDMISLSKQQLAKAEEQLRVVSFTSPKTGERVTLAAGPAQFGSDLNESGESVSSYAVLVDPYKACSWPLSDKSTQQLKGKIGIVERGDCMFVQKSRHVQRCGGLGVIVVDNVPHTSSQSAPMFAMSGDGSTDVNIPVVFLYGQEGSVLLDTLDQYPDMIVHLDPSVQEVRAPKSPVQPKKKRTREENTHDSEKWFEVNMEEDENDDDEVAPEVPAALQGVAHITELTKGHDNEGQEKVKLVPGSGITSGKNIDIEKVMKHFAVDLSKKYLNSVNKFKEEAGVVDNKLVEGILNSVIESSMKTLKEMIDTNNYKVLEPVVSNVVKSMKNLNEAQANLQQWLQEIGKDSALEKRVRRWSRGSGGVSPNPSSSRSAFLRRLLEGWSCRSADHGPFLSSLGDSYPQSDYL